MNTKEEKYLSYEKAIEFVHQLKIKSQREWQKYASGLLTKEGRPKNIPFNPQRYYKNKGWKNWQSWLNTNNLKHNQKHFLPYEEAKIIVHSFKFKNKEEWDKFCNDSLKSKSEYSDVISRDPGNYYRNNGWKGWEDWLGCKIIKFVSYEEAKKYAAKINIKTYQEWRNLDKNQLPANIPRSPESAYKSRGDWISWGDFLGTNNIAPKNKKFISYEKAIKFVHKLKLKSQKEWILYTKRKLENYDVKPMNIPVCPDVVYKNKDWTGWKDWLGY